FSFIAKWNNFTKQKTFSRMPVSPVLNKRRLSVRKQHRRSQSLPSLNCGSVLFLVGKQKRPYLVQSFLLTVVSEVFRVLFTSWHSNAIEISDVQPSAFKIFIQFLSVRQQNLRNGGPPEHRGCKPTNIKRFLNAYYLGHKYNIQSFLSYLEDSISSLITAENVLETLVHADMYQSSRLRSYCWSYIERNTSRVVNSVFFPHLPWHQLFHILENDHLTIGEYDLFQGFLKWCRASQRLQAVGSKIHTIIGEAIYKIRFPLMTRQEFQFVIQSGVLKQREIDDLTNNFHRNQMFINRHRKNICSCRSNKIPCSLCTICPQFTSLTKSLDGRVSIEFCGASQNWCRGILGNCECAKYVSCPSFPNGATDILMQTVLRNRKVDSLELTNKSINQSMEITSLAESSSVWSLSKSAGLQLCTKVLVILVLIVLLFHEMEYLHKFVYSAFI
ncbi:unnamed protein product, partial [Allacma fusca]